MLKLSDRNWKEYHLSSIISSIKRGTVKDVTILPKGNTIVIGAAGVNEGFSTFGECESKFTNSMTISFNGVGTGTAFVHNYPFNLNSDCGLVNTDPPLSVNVLRFIQCSINMHKDKFNYGYKANETRMQRQIILLPSDKNGNPDYKFMEQFIKEREKNKRNEYIKYCKQKLSELGDIIEVEAFDWQPIQLSLIGDIKSGKDIYAKERIEGVRPYITSGTSNNGIGYFVSNSNRTIDKGYIAMNRNGAVGEAFYHCYESLMGNDCRKIHVKARDNNIFVGLFVSMCITKQKKCFSYSRKLGTERAKKMRIMLPVNKSGQPDYDYMEQYIKNTMIKKYSYYLAYLENNNQNANI